MAFRGHAVQRQPVEAGRNFAAFAQLVSVRAARPGSLNSDAAADVQELIKDCTLGCGFRNVKILGKGGCGCALRVQLT